MFLHKSVRVLLKCSWLKWANERHMWLQPSPLKQRSQFEELSVVEPKLLALEILM